MQAKLGGAASHVITGRPSLYTSLMAASGLIQGGSICGGLDSARKPLKIRDLILATTLILVWGAGGWHVIQGLSAAIVPAKPADLVASLPAATAATLPVTSQAKGPAVIVADAGVSVIPVKIAEAQLSDAAPIQAQSQVAHEQSLGPKEQLLPLVATAVQAPPVINAAQPAAKYPVTAAPGRPSSKAAVPEKTLAIAAARPDEMRKSAAAGTSKNSRKTAGIRESVSPRPADTAQAQLQRCNTLGFFEAEMCRLRTCTGRWGSAPGCPEYAQNSSVAP